MRARIGTSGFNYDVWLGRFYPEQLPEDRMLSYYSDHFDTVEINLTFYRTPEKNVYKNWRKEVPEDFIFSMKANRYITHMKNLKDVQDSLTREIEHHKILGEKLGPVLFQLSERWTADIERLRSFVEKLPGDDLHVLELRHESWFKEEVYEILRENNIAFCIQDIKGVFSPIIRTSDFVYIRFHGPKGDYRGNYEEDELRKWALRINNWLARDIQVYAYFNNTDEGHAPNNALRILELIQENGS